MEERITRDQVRGNDEGREMTEQGKLEGRVEDVTEGRGQEESTWWMG